ncbi:hypothetical protein ES288_A05G112800v1 [Gossypium darwinii]|uniref:Uncharacterized protein n=1 Tax=Gossypium darwinii TaxID=34276 RepID=A0A5D2GE01_GOSDA|nr:hypothetical protein ES288_A05G112800v1 [Gossypium darwinii]
MFLLLCLCWLDDIALLVAMPFQLSGLFDLSSSSVDYFVVDDVIHRTVGPACVVMLFAVIPFYLQ